MTFCSRHTWETVSTSYTPPSKTNNGLLPTEESEAHRLYGSTHVYQVCKHCGTVKSEILTGKVKAEAIKSL